MPKRIKLQSLMQPYIHFPMSKCACVVNKAIVYLIPGVTQAHWKIDRWSSLCGNTGSDAKPKHFIVVQEMFSLYLVIFRVIQKKKIINKDPMDVGVSRHNTTDSQRMGVYTWSMALLILNLSFHRLVICSGWSGPVVYFNHVAKKDKILPVSRGK